MMTLNKTIFTLLMLISWFIAPVAPAQTPPTPRSIAELTSLLKSEMEQQHVAGMMLTIVSKDSVLYAGGLGLADIEKKTPVTERHLFRQGSITKLFTALAVLKLVDEGKLRMDSRLKDIAPEVPFHNYWEETSPITIGQLLEHSTGFHDKTPLEEFNYADRNTNSLEALEVFRKFMVAQWEPGERHSYSNVNYAILTYLIEKVSGESFQSYLRAKIFSPIGMPDANVHLTGDATDAYSKGYVWQENQFRVVPHRPQFVAGNGSLNASALDFAHALQVYLRNGNTPEGQFLPEQMLYRSETPQTYLSAQAGLQNSYACGNESREVGGRVFRGHSGSIAGYLSNFLYNREIGLGFAFSINTYNEGFYWYATDLIARFITQHHPEYQKQKVFPLDETTVSPYLGYYRLSNSPDFYTGYFKGLQHTFKLEQGQDGLRANFLLGGSMAWKSADSSRLLFINEWAKDPRILLLRDGNNKPVIVEDTLYFKKISILEAWVPLSLLLLSLLLLLSSLPYGLASAILILLRRQKNLRLLLLRISPALATLALLLSIWTLPQFTLYTMAGIPTSNLMLLWMAGKYGFALFALCSVVLLMLRWKNMQSNWQKSYFVMLTLSSCYLLGLLVMSHWY
ncbi:serine hydrolase domain-containing protein [Pontibacter anaerobius]|uniref:Serine hydrolase n=1 Tax=Pontibacter anaerobius TaxID=2993940 RepID=A0ABT3RC57_9BACT|nr:serine hydrolase domain-containing protein [Pontibacter anaerobius]MCX2739439.1 serine hydrolase [Pontibacter anaerobius]